MTLVYLGCAWLLGIYLGVWLHLPAWALGAAAILCTALAVALRRRRDWSLACVCLVVGILGLWRYDLARPRLTSGPLAAYNGTGRVALRGLVVEEPRLHDRYADVLLSVQELEAEGAWRPMQGLVLVQAPSYQDWRYGDELEVSGSLEAPSSGEESSYSAYLARRGIHSLIRYPHVELIARDRGRALPAILYNLNRRTRSLIASILPEPEAALLNGILVGSDGGIPERLMDQFRATGTAHVIAISGFNIAIISAFLVKWFSRFLHRYVALIAASVVIGLYAILVGAEPPVLRAALMGGLAALALIVGRKSHALTSLVAAAWAITAWQPFTLWEVGFQLSFLATLGLILYSERLTRWTQSTLERIISMETAQRITRVLDGTVLVTLAAQVTILPLVLVQFGQVSLFGLLANVLILPVQPAIISLGGLAAMLAHLSLRLGQAFGWAAWLFLTYTVRVAEALSHWSSVALTASRVHPLVPWVYWGFLAWLTFAHPPALPSPAACWRWLRKGIQYKALVTALVVVAVLVWIAVAGLPDGRLHVTFVDVGQGDATLIRTPTGRRILIDGGPSPDLLLTALGRHLPFWDRRIDILLLSHAHDDHLRALLPVLERYQVRQVLVGSVAAGTALAEQWQQSLQDRRIPLLEVKQSLQIDCGDGPMMQVLPYDVESGSAGTETWLVARLRWEDASFLFTGDLEADDLLRLSKAGWPLACTALKVPHHGSSQALNDALLAAIQPRLAVISVGAENRYGHPAPGTLACLEAAGVRTLRTDEVGTTEVTTDGKGFVLQTEKP